MQRGKEERGQEGFGIQKTLKRGQTELEQISKKEV